MHEGEAGSRAERGKSKGRVLGGFEARSRKRALDKSRLASKGRAIRANVGMIYLRCNRQDESNAGVAASRP